MFSNPQPRTLDHAEPGERFPQITVLGKSLTLKGFLYTEIVSDDAALEAGKAFITEGLASGELKPVIARTFSLDQIQDTHRFLESNEQVGKVIVTVSTTTNS